MFTGEELLTYQEEIKRRSMRPIGRQRPRLSPIKRNWEDMSSPRKLSYSLAVNEALHQMMAADDAVFLIGQGVKSPWYVGNTAQGLLERFGSGASSTHPCRKMP